MADLLLLGCGKMGRAVLEGVISSGAIDATRIAVVEPGQAARESLMADHPEIAVLDKPVEANTCIVATKPSQVPAALASLATSPPKLLVSIAAGVTTAKLEEEFGSVLPIVRAMPNTPGQIGMGITAICAGRHAEGGSLSRAALLLSGLGEVVIVPEIQMDAVTAISGSGPAYFFYMVEAMVDAGIEMGLSAEMAAKLAATTMAGASELLSRREFDTRLLRLEVSSPGGTTIAATNVFDEMGVRSGIRAGILASYRRSAELGMA